MKELLVCQKKPKVEPHTAEVEKWEGAEAFYSVGKPQSPNM